MAGRTAKALSLGDEERAELEALTRATSVSAGVAARARIVLLAADATPNHQIAELVGVSRPTVNKWRERFSEQRLAGLVDVARHVAAGVLSIRKDQSRGPMTSASKSRRNRSLAALAARKRAGSQSSRSSSIAAASSASSRGQKRASTPSSQSSATGPIMPATMGRPAAIPSMMASDDDSEYEAWTYAR